MERETRQHSEEMNNDLNMFKRASFQKSHLKTHSPNVHTLYRHVPCDSMYVCQIFFFVGVEYGSRDCVFRTVLKEDEVGGTIPLRPVLRNDGVM